MLMKSYQHREKKNNNCDNLYESLLIFGGKDTVNMVHFKYKLKIYSKNILNCLKNKLEIPQKLDR